MGRFIKRSWVAGSPAACCLLLVTLASLTVPVTAYRQGIQIETSPQVIKETILQGEARSLKVKVTNKGSVPVEVVPEVVDLSIDEQGYNVEMPQDAGYAWGLKEFVKVFPERFTLKPGETRIAEVTVNAPGPLSGGRYGILYFAASDPSARDRIVMVVRCGSLLFITVPGTETYSGRVRDLKFTPRLEDSGSPGALEVVFENTGNVHMSAAGSMKISDGRKTLVNMALKGGTGTILPGGARLYRAELREDMPCGEYKVTATFVFEGKTITAEKTLRVNNRQASSE